MMLTDNYKLGHQSPYAKTNGGLLTLNKKCVLILTGNLVRREKKYSHLSPFTYNIKWLIIQLLKIRILIF